MQACEGVKLRICEFENYLIVNEGCGLKFWDLDVLDSDEAIFKTDVMEIVGAKNKKQKKPSLIYDMKVVKVGRWIVMVTT